MSRDFLGGPKGRGFGPCFTEFQKKTSAPFLFFPPRPLPPPPQKRLLAKMFFCYCFFAPTPRGHIHRYINGHCDSMKELAKGPIL